MVSDEDDIKLLMRRGRPFASDSSMIRYPRRNAEALLSTYADLIIRDPSELGQLFESGALDLEGKIRLNEIVAQKLREKHQKSVPRTSSPDIGPDCLSEPVSDDQCKRQRPEFLYARCSKWTRESFELAFYELIENRLKLQKQRGGSTITARVSKIEAGWLLVRTIYSGWWESFTQCLFTLKRRIF